jgi:hypothetical protein
MDTYTLITVEELNANHIFSFSGPNNLNWIPMVMVMLMTSYVYAKYHVGNVARRLCTGLGPVFYQDRLT